MNGVMTADTRYLCGSWACRFYDDFKASDKAKDL